jgi:hypothetical protein
VLLAKDLRHTIQPLRNVSALKEWFSHKNNVSVNKKHHIYPKENVLAVSYQSFLIILVICVYLVRMDLTLAQQNCSAIK